VLRPGNSVGSRQQARVPQLDIGRGGFVLQYGRQQLAQPWSVALKPGVTDAVALDEMHQTLVGALAAVGPAKSRINITISDALTRTFVLRRLPGLAGIEEIECVARDQFARLYGEQGDSGNQGNQGDQGRFDAVGAWAVQVDAIPFARHWPVFAVPQMLIDRIVSAAAANGLVAGRIEPRFVFACNDTRVRPSWLAGLGWPGRRARTEVLSLQTTESLTLGIRAAGNWLSLRSHPPLAATGVDLATMIRRECRALGIAVEDCVLRSLPSLAWDAVLPDGVRRP